MNAVIPREMHDDVTQRDLGVVLKSARADAGLTVADVSQQLHLAESVVTALEANEHGDLPAAFVRGYVRAYGKLLDLDGERLVELYNRSGVADPDIAPVTALASQHARGDPLMRWMTAVVIGVLAVMMVVYWQTEDGAPPPLVQTDPEPAPMQAAPPSATDATGAAADAASSPAASGPVASLGPVPDEPAGEPARAAAQAPTAGSAPAAAPAVSTTVAAADVPSAPSHAVTLPASVAEPSAAEAPAAATGAATTSAAPAAPAGGAGYETVASRAPAPAPAPANGQPLASAASARVAVATAASADAAQPPATTTTVPASSGETAVPDEAAPAAQAQEPPPPPVPLAGDDELLLTVTGESWVEVTDPGGARLFYGLYRTGDELRVTGRAPFTLFLGNSPDVEIRLNGARHDQSAFNRRNNTARFKLDADGPRRN